MFGLGKPARPRAIAFDIIGTCFPLEPLRPRIVALGLPPAGLEGWFAAGCRDAFALAAAGDFKFFAKVLDAALAGVLAEQGLSAGAAERRTLIQGLTTLDPRPDTQAAFRLAADAGLPVIALSNGAHAATATLLDRAGLTAQVAHIVSIDAARAAKPRREPYELAADIAKVKAGELALIAAHPWDVNGAKAAGLVTAYLTADRPFSPVMRRSDVEGATLTDCVRALLAL